MRKKIVSLLLFALCCTTAFAQQKIYIHLKSGETLTKNVSEIDSISFTEPTVAVAKVSTGSPSSIGSTKATIPVTITATMSQVSAVGVAYSTTADAIDVTGNNVSFVSSGYDGGSCDIELSGLSPNALYYYVAYAIYNDETIYGDTLSFATVGKFPVPEAVDLGLSVKWAAWNMGAESIADYGSLIAWGDPTGESTSFNPYDFNCGYTTEDISGTDYDVAHVQWGSKWRLPTSNEMKELANLTWTYKSNYEGSGVNGWIIKGTNGDSIFIPRAGFENAEGLKYQGQQAYYWSSEYGGADKYNSATGCNIYANDISSATYEKILRMSIRPVYGDKTVYVDPNDPVDVDGHEAIELGLSVKWASCNIGASKASEAGSYFAWGETSAKSEYTRDNYEYYNDSAYVELPSDIGGTSYDAATAAWGSKWRMPTRAELDALYSYCDVTWTTQDGVYGYKFTSQTNGNFIFIPAAGYMDDGAVVNAEKGYYWSSTNGKDRYGNEGMSYDFEFSSGNNHVTSHDYCRKGLLIRPVVAE